MTISTKAMISVCFLGATYYAFMDEYKNAFDTILIILIILITWNNEKPKT